MEHISVEEFLKQPENVQKEFLYWVNSNATYCDLVYIKDRTMLYKDYLNRDKSLIDEDSYPLLTEGQLRKFIEDKTKCGLLIYTPDENMEACIQLFNNDGQIYKNYEDLGHNLLQAYWFAACKIASED